MNRNNLADSDRKLLSFAVGTRNDGYLPNFEWRINTVVNYLARNLMLIGRLADAEIVITDWGSETPIYKVLDLIPAAKKIVKFVLVPQEAAIEAQKDSTFPLVITWNVAARRCEGEFIIVIDTDGLIPALDLQRMVDILEGRIAIGSDPRQTNMFVSRRQISRVLATSRASLEEIDQYLRLNAAMTRVDPLYPGMTAPIGCYVSYRGLWEELGGVDERLIHWGYSEIDYNLRATQTHRWIDLANLGVNYFHIEHEPNLTNRKTKERRINPHEVVQPFKHHPNGAQWGLGDCDLEIYTFPESKQENYGNETLDVKDAGSQNARIRKFKSFTLADIQRQLTSPDLRSSVSAVYQKFIELQDLKDNRLEKIQSIMRGYVDIYQSPSQGPVIGLWDHLQALHFYAKTFFPANYLEVGIGRGEASVLVSDGNPTTSIYGFDTWGFDGETKPLLSPLLVSEMLMFLNHQGYVQVIIQPILNGVKSFFTSPDQPKQLDLIYIETDQSTDQNYQIILELIPRLALGGMAIFRTSDPELVQSIWTSVAEQYPRMRFLRCGQTGLLINAELADHTRYLPDLAETVTPRLLEEYSTCLEEGRLDVAGQILGQLLLVQPEQPTSMNALASFYLHTNREELAIQIYDSVLSRNPTNGEALLAASEFYLKMGHEAHVHRLVDCALEASPEHEIARKIKDILQEPSG